MISRIAKFHKVSFEQFKGDWEDTFGKQEDIRSIYEDIRLPERATSGSAGYDFFAPKAFLLMALVVFLAVKAISRLEKIGKQPEAPKAPTEKKCPYCSTMIPLSAVRCPHCTSNLDEQEK